MSNKFQIKFTAGTLASQVFEIQPGVVIALGRSRSNTIVLSEPDVSARHCILRQDQQAEEGIWIEVVSSRTTVLDGKALQIGDKALITDGKQVTLGEKAAFVLMKVANNTAENDDMPTGQIQNGDDMQTQAVPAEDDQQTRAATMEKTAAQAQTAEQNPAPETAAAGSDTEFETVAVQTRIASTEEIDFIRRGHQKKRLIRFWLIVIPIVIFVVASFALYFQPKEEPALQIERNRVTSYFLHAKFLRIICRSVQLTPLVEDKDNNYVEIRSAFGEKNEIPLYIYTHYWNSMEALNFTRNETFRKECLPLLEKKLGWEPDRDSELVLKQRWIALEDEYTDSPGIPVSFTEYTRSVKDQNGNPTSRTGILLFWRSGISCGYGVVEVPTSDFEKHPLFFSQYFASCFTSYGVHKENTDYAACYWEGSSNYDKDTTISDLLKKIERFENSGRYADWWNRFYAIRSVLIRTRPKGREDENYKKAQEHLLNLRKEQKKVYGRWRLTIIGSSDEDVKARVKRDSKQAFSPEFESVDYRYGAIRREEW